MEQTSKSRSRFSSHVILPSYTEIRHTDLKVLVNYPELENPLDLRVPLHFADFNGRPIGGSLEDQPEISGVWEKIHTELRRLLIHHGIGFRSFGYYAMVKKEDDGGFQTGKIRENYRVVEKDWSCHILIDLENEEEGKWKLIHREAVAFIAEQFKTIDREPVPLRYGGAYTYEYYY